MDDAVIGSGVCILPTDVMIFLGVVMHLRLESIMS